MTFEEFDRSDSALRGGEILLLVPAHHLLVRRPHGHFLPGRASWESYCYWLILI